jgi:Zn-dependent protease
MLSKKEIGSILLVSIVLAICLSSLASFEKLTYSFVLFLGVISINVFAKKIRAYYLEIEIEHSLWSIRRFGVKPWKKFPKPIYFGLFLPLFLWALTQGTFIWMATLVFDAKGKIYRAAKRHGIYKFSEISEEEIGNIATVGLLANLFFGFLSYFLNLPEFGRLNIYYAVFNIIPLSSLDGNKIFFVHFKYWCAITAITLIALLYAVFLI